MHDRPRETPRVQRVRQRFRQKIQAPLRRIAAQANGRLPADEQMAVSPHVLRHTFLRKLAETKGVHYAKEASGHQSDRYIWRYVQPHREALAEAIDALAFCHSLPHVGNRPRSDREKKGLTVTGVCG